MQRRAYLMRLKIERIRDYVDIHGKEAIWKSVVDGLVRSGISRMIIFRHGQDIILFEEAPDLKAAYDYLGKDEESARWDAMICEWMEEYPRFNEIRGDLEFTEIPIVFHFEEGELLH